MSMKNIVAAVDFSSVTERVVETAAEIARVCGAKLWLLHVESLQTEPADFSAGPQTVRDSVAKELKYERHSLQEIADRLKARGIDATSLLVEGDIATTIIKQAQKVEADMVVVGTHGHTGLLSRILGSITETLITKSAVPVLLIHPPKRKETQMRQEGETVHVR